MRAQVSAEFLVLVGIGSLMLILILGLLYMDTLSIAREKEITAIEDLGGWLSNEISMASRVSDGYTRIFTIPDRKDGIEFNITKYGNSSIIIISKSTEREFIVPAYIGNLTKGVNKIDRLGGIVYVNVI